MSALQLTAEEIAELPEGVSLKTVGRTKLVLFKEAGKLQRACKNQCAHMGGEFKVDVEDVAKHYVQCSMHGWKMDASTMTYPDQLKSITTCCKKANAETPQPQFAIEQTAGGAVRLTEGRAGGNGPPPAVGDIEDVQRATCAGLGPCAVEVKPGGGPAGGKYAWCTCGLSKNQPYCDGSHTQIPGHRGPLLFEATEEKTVYLCACKATKNPPYCDGSHSALTEDCLGKPLPAWA